LSQSQTRKLAKIVEVLGVLEENKKGKDWLVNQIRQHKYKVAIKPTMNSVEILKACPDKLISHIKNALNGNVVHDIDIDLVQRSMTKNFFWFYTDIVGSANPAILTTDQARKVWALNELIGRTETFKQLDQKSDVMAITGDGVVIGFSDSTEKPLRLAIELHKLISRYNEHKKVSDRLEIRIGIDAGAVYFIKDLMGKNNFWGPGIIMARRVMDLARPRQILASARIANVIRRLTPEYKTMVHYCGEYKIKHGEKLQIYNIYGDTWGHRVCPPIKEVEPTPLPLISNFLFPKIELWLNITEPKTMMTHHTWIWNMVNISNSSTDQVKYFITGDVPRDFSNLNLNVRDGSGKKLKILSVNVNKPLEKEFIVQLSKPVKPNHTVVLKMEYDWEEPERKFHYSLATDCKKFTYLLTIPKRIEIKPRVLKVDPARQRVHAPVAPQIIYQRQHSVVRWNVKNLRASETYQFEW